MSPKKQAKKRKSAPKKASSKKSKKPAKKAAPQSASKKTQSAALKLKKTPPVTSVPAAPLWYQPGAALGSAVRYIASISPLFNWVGIYKLKGKMLELGPFIGAETEHTRIPVGRGVCGTAVAENRDMNVPDVRSHDNYLACSLETRSELVVLIKDRTGKILGQIDIDSHTPNAFGPAEEAAVKRVAEELGELW